MSGWRWLAILAAGAAIGGAACAQSGGGRLTRLRGDWEGKLDTGALTLRLILHVHAEQGKTVASLDSPDQGATGLPATVTVTGDEVRIAAKGAAGAFEGRLTKDDEALTGAWSGLPITFVRRAPGEAVIRPVRPQTPAPPFPYHVRDVSFENAAAQVRLAGTLTIPRGSGPFPAVVLIAGSGAHGRDETVFGHRIFLVLADYLTRHGVAVLRYDKRGVGGSSGDYAGATSTDFAADADAAAAYLRTLPSIDPGRIGLIGHSEGGEVAPMVALADPDIAFIVLMAGPAIPGDQIIMAQSHDIAKAAGATPAALAQNAAVERRFLDAVMAAKDGAAAEAGAAAVLKAAGMAPAMADAQARAAASPWYRFFLKYDPAPALMRLRIPVLALIGSRDLQVPAAENIPALRRALAGDRRATVLELPGLNHLFQTATTGAPSEYGKIEQTIAPSALATIADWIGRETHGVRTGGMR